MSSFGRMPVSGTTHLARSYSYEESKFYTKKCPNCNAGVGVKASETLEFDHSESFINVYECPLCKQEIIRMFKKHDSSFRDYILISEYPKRKTITHFSDDIKNISEDFIKIYNESEIAENNNLINICGPGYRKALEFLIKDYIIKKDPDKESQIKKKFLGNCIKEDIDDVRIKDTAQRAVWIGNDETHYERKWESKDVKDLKAFIMLTLYWIESEIQYNKMKEEMPD